jgi:hypothetical protein
VEDTPQESPALPPELAAKITKDTPPCMHCGGWHARSCPRVRRMVWHSGGALAEVEFWPDGRWSDAYVLWPEQLDDEDPTPEASQ